MDKKEALQQAWQQCRIDNCADDWTVGEASTYRGFFTLGWDAAVARASDDAADAALYRRFNPMWCDALNRRATVEQWMFEAANGKRSMPTPDDLRAWALKLGTPSKDATELAAAMSGKGGAE